MTNNDKQQLKSSKTLAIAALVFAVASVTCWQWFGWIYGTISAILSIISISIGNRGKEIAEASIMVSIIGISIGVVLTITGTVKTESNAEVSDKSNGTNVCLTYRCTDNSVIEFNSNGEYSWYEDKTDHSNAKLGTYEIYFKDDALDFLTKEHPEYGITEKFEPYSSNNFVLIVLNNESIKVDGKLQEAKNTTIHFGFLGFYDHKTIESGTSSQEELTYSNKQ